MTALPPVSVLLPAWREGPALADAAACVLNQTHADLELLILLNSADAATEAAADALTAADPRVRLERLPPGTLAATLNAGLALARHEFIARMDADDRCEPERLALQADCLRAHPRIAALGTWFQGVDEHGSPIGVDRPPTDHATIRWRLHLGNLFCHGSMMLRKAAVLSVGGYDATLTRAQDYDLWLRLARTPGFELANLPRVLYRYTTSLAKRAHEQAAAAARAMTESWTLLAPADQDTRAQLATLIASSAYGGAAARTAHRSLEQLLTARGPTREALLAWWHIAHRAGLLSEPLYILHRIDRVRTAGQRLQSIGITAVTLYGSGAHTQWLIENADELAIPIAGIVDDRHAGSSRWGFTIGSPADLPPGTHVLLSSDAHEPALLAAAAPLRTRGIHIHTIYSSSPA